MPDPVHPLDFPFFTLEYRDGIFVRKIPPDAEALRGGLFRQGDKLRKLSTEDAKKLPEIIRGKGLLSLVNRGMHPLVIAGPRAAAGGERLMELNLERGSAIGVSNADCEGPGRGPVIISINRELVCADLWLPLDGLPRHRLYNNTVYKIIDEETLGHLIADYGAHGKGDRLILRGEEIPRFAAAFERLLYRFAGGQLRRLLSEKNVFIATEKLSLTLTAAAKMDHGVGQAQAEATLKYGKRLYSAAEVSSLMERDYILLDNKWASRETVKKAGILPLSCLAGGTPITEYPVSASEIIMRGTSALTNYGGGTQRGKRKAVPQIFTGFEFENTPFSKKDDRPQSLRPPNLWLPAGTHEEVFIAHLEFLRYWGICGGVILHGHREQAACLAAWLAELASSMKKTGRALILMEQEYCELYLPRFLPRLNDINSIGVEIGFYENLPASGPQPKCDTLVLVEPEEIFDRDKTWTAVSRIDTALRLGIFSNYSSQSEAPALRNFFGVRRTCFQPDPGGGCLNTENYIIRNVKAPLSLPPPCQRSTGKIRQPPGIFQYKVETKFRNIPVQDLIAERERFRREKKCKLDVQDLILHARDLIVFVDAGPEENFKRLLEHYTECHADCPGLRPCHRRMILPWIMDFALVYNIPDALSRLSPFVHEVQKPLLTDLYIHRFFIDENNPIGLDDIRLLLPHFFDSITAIPEKESALVLNAIDRYLREHFKIRFFEFFYPPVSTRKTFTAFEGLEGIGESSYTAEWILFSSHKPLLDFFETLLRYIPFRTNAETHFDRRRQVPPLNGVWKEIADAVLEQREVQAPQSVGGTGLKKETLERLRNESAEIQDLLRIGGGENSNAFEEASPPATRFIRMAYSGVFGRLAQSNPSAAVAADTANTANAVPGTLAGFLAGLGPVEEEALSIIAGGCSATPPSRAVWRTAALSGTVTPISAAPFCVLPSCAARRSTYSWNGFAISMPPTTAINRSLGSGNWPLLWNLLFPPPVRRNLSLPGNSPVILSGSSTSSMMKKAPILTP
jgi:hypothetical protein